jgi:hypothetical protein
VWGGIWVYYNEFIGSVMLGLILGGILGYMIGLYGLTKKISYQQGIIFLLLFITFITGPPNINPLLINFKRNFMKRTIEEELKFKLTNLRKAISLYFKTHKRFPKELATFDFQLRFLGGLMKYYPVILPAKDNEGRKILHNICCDVLYVSTKPTKRIQFDQITDEGGWIYSSDSGDIRINCSHKDSKGIPYYEW